MVLVLGMGLPTTPSYIIAAAIGVPQTARPGRDLLPAHLFIFYFAVLADATPPVAAAAFAAASVAGAPPTLTSLHATRFGIAGFTVGFAFVYDPGIMLRGGVADILLATAVQIAALVAITAAYAGYLTAPIGAAARALLGAAGLAAAFLHLLSAPRGWPWRWARWRSSMRWGARGLGRAGSLERARALPS